MPFSVTTIKRWNISVECEVQVETRCKTVRSFNVSKEHTSQSRCLSSIVRYKPEDYVADKLICHEYPRQSAHVAS
jgi:hypothetical protein